MAKKQKVQVTVFNGSQYEANGWPPEDPEEFMAWFQERIERIPPEHRKNATIQFGAQSDYYDGSTATIEITYLCDETDEQMEGRLARDKAQKRQHVEQEKALLAALQAKYGKP